MTATTPSGTVIPTATQPPTATRPPTATQPPTTSPGGQVLAQLLQIAIGATVFIVTLPLTLVIGAFALANMIFHYIVDGGVTRIVGYQARAGSEYVPGLPPNTTVKNLDTVTLTSFGEVIEPPQSPPSDSLLLATATLCLMTLTIALGSRLRRRTDRA